MGSSSPGFGVKNTKYLSCHHLDILAEIQRKTCFLGHWLLDGSIPPKKTGYIILLGYLTESYAQNQLAKLVFEPTCSSNWIMKPPGFGVKIEICLSYHHILIWIISPSCFFPTNYRRLHWSVSSGQFPQFFFQGSKISPKGQSGPKTSYRQSIYMG